MEKPITKAQIERQLNSLQEELVKRISKLHKEKFSSNNSHLAEAAGCSETTIRRLLRNEQNLTMIMLCKIAYAFKITPSELMYGIGINEESK